MIRLRTKFIHHLKLAPLALAAAATFVLSSASHGGTLFPAWRNLYDLDPAGGKDRSQYSGGVAVDGRGNVAICGYIESPSGQDLLFVAKYSGLDGRTFEWARVVRAPSYAGNTSPSAYGTSVAVDANGNVVVTGAYQTANGYDYLTFKLDGRNGGTLWGLAGIGQVPDVVYNNTDVDGLDTALKVIVDNAGDVIVTGRSSGSGTQGDIYTVKYSGSTGAFLWSHRYNSPTNRDDIPTALAVDAGDNVYVGGYTDRFGSDSAYVTKLSSGGAVQAGWPKIDQNGGYGATGLAVDRFGNVFVAGPARNGSDYDIKTVKYSSAGGQLWARQVATETPENRWCGIAVDSDGKSSVIGLSAAESNGRRMYTVRYDAAGTVEWDRYSPAPEDDDLPKALIVDGTSNTIVFGESTRRDSRGDLQDGLYIATYSPIDGDIIDEVYLSDLDPDFDKTVESPIVYRPQVAFDDLGGVALVANYKKPTDPGSIIYTGFSAIKFNRLILEKGDFVNSNNVEGRISAIGSPAVADSGTVAARVGISISKKKKVNAILTQGTTGEPFLPAVQNAAAPGGGKFKSFLDPVLSNNGRLAFIAKLADVPAAESTAVFSTINGALAANIKTGQSLPGLTGATVKSISAIAVNGISGNQLVALLKIAGTINDEKITNANDTVLVGVNSGGTTVLLRTGQDITVGGEATTVKSITTLTGPKGSAGQGRWLDGNRVVARLLLADGRVAVASVSETGILTVIRATGGDAGFVAAGAKWKTFGLPGTGSGAGSQFVTLGALQTDSTVGSNEDNALVYGTNNGLSVKVAQEGADVPSIDNARYASFLDPVVNASGQLAFLATIEGGKVSGSNKTVLMFGTPGSPDVLVRTGDSAPDTGAFNTEQKFTSISSFALPSGTGAGPIFLAKVAGKGVSARNNQGVWALDSFGKLRQLLRTGDNLGGRIVTRITLLDSRPGVSGSTRNFNARGSVLALVNFKGGNSGVYAIGIP